MERVEALVKHLKIDRAEFLEDAYTPCLEPDCGGERKYYDILAGKGWFCAKHDAKWNWCEAKLRRAAIWDLDLAEAKKLLQEYKFDRYDLETTAKRIDDGWKFREAKGENLVLDRTDTKRREIVGVLHEYIRSYK